MVKPSKELPVLKDAVDVFKIVDIDFFAEGFELADMSGWCRAFKAPMSIPMHLAWPMVKRGGVIVFDDYEWTMTQSDAERLKPGFDVFLAGQAGQYRELYRGYQVIIEKL